MRQLLTRGFTLIEALISVLIVTFVVLFVLNTVTLFPILIRKDIINFCLRQAANSAVEYKRANPTDPTDTMTISCKGMDIEVSISGGTPPPNDCVDITVTATYRSYSYEIQDKICNF